MTRSDRIQQILDAALRITSEDDRMQFLEQACDDDAMQVEVRALLENWLSDRSSRVDIASTRKDRSDLPSTLEVASENLEGIEIGPYRLGEAIGRGGFGVVYRARQDEPIQRDVAIKLIKPGMDSHDIISRFENERQALALMDHPSIATILDAGQTKSGRPYFVMELVAGQPLTRYCDSRRLSLRSRLELFIQICFAVQHAHQKGIIHRDLKPANILVEEVDGQPAPKIIDFGIAKALDMSLSPAIHTLAGQLIGTPLYMSPEQAARSSQVDVRSDIYSLGALLFELVTGSTPIPFEVLDRDGRESVIQRICEHATPRASKRLESSRDSIADVANDRQTSPSRLLGSVRGDLDWILTKALAMEPDQRYDSASAFGNDLQRYLNNDPIEARRPSRRYHFLKFCRKHRRGVVTAAAFLGVVIAAAAISIVSAFESSKAAEVSKKNEDIAKRAVEDEKAAKIEEAKRRREAEATLDFVLSSFRPPNSMIHGEPVAFPTFLDQFADECLKRDFADSPLSKAKILRSLGNVYLSVKLPEKSVRLFSDALAIYRQELGDNHPDSIELMGRIAASEQLFTTMQAESLKHWEQAIARKKESGNAHLVLVGDNPRRSLEVEYFFRLANIPQRREEAFQFGAEVIQFAKERFGDFHPKTTYIRLFVGCHFGSHGGPRAKEARIILERIVGEIADGKIAYDPEVFQAIRQRCGPVLTTDLEKRLFVHDTLIEVEKRSLGPRQMLSSIAGKANLLHMMLRFEEMKTEVQSVLRVLSDQEEGFSAEAIAECNKLGSQIADGPDLKMAEQLLVDTFNASLKSLGVEHQQSHIAKHNIVYVRILNGDYQGAIDLLKIQRYQYGNHAMQHELRVVMHHNLALCYFRLGNPSQATSELQMAYQLSHSLQFKGMPQKSELFESELFRQFVDFLFLQNRYQDAFNFARSDRLEVDRTRVFVDRSPWKRKLVQLRAVMRMAAFDRGEALYEELWEGCQKETGVSLFRRSKQLKTVYAEELLRHKSYRQVISLLTEEEEPSPDWATKIDANLNCLLMIAQWEIGKQSKDEAFLVALRKRISSELRKEIDELTLPTRELHGNYIYRTSALTLADVQQSMGDTQWAREWREREKLMREPWPWSPVGPVRLNGVIHHKKKHFW